MKPTVGRTVHYHQGDSPPFVAFITETLVDEDDKVSDYVNLYVISPTRPFYKMEVPFNSEPLKDHWSWPPKV